MDEFLVKQKIQNACVEPEAPEALVQSVILRAHAVVLGEQAQKAMQTAPAEQMGSLAASAVVGQLAEVSVLPKGVRPEQLARQLRQEPAFSDALRGGNLLRRVHSGELMQQLTGKKPSTEKAPRRAFPTQKGWPCFITRKT